nr:fip1[v]-like protein [Quercus suber]
MEEFGDDFGDLYTDVEIQASSAINGIPGLANSYIESMEEEEEEEEDNNVTNEPNPNQGLGSNSQIVDEVHDGSAQKTMGSELNMDSGSDSDSDDDLNIVLNDEDCNNFPSTSGGNGGVGSGPSKIQKRGNQSGDGLELSSNGERGNGVRGGYNSLYPQYKYMRPHGSVFPSNIKGNGSVGMASYPSMLTRGDQDDTTCNQHKGSIASQVAQVRATANVVVGQSGYGFSLPWYRTILDINIDTFEDQPWRFPGVDITDFFNFGFNEDTWKQYCKSLEQIRQQAFLQTGIPVYESPKTNQAHEAETEHERGRQNPMVEESYQVGLQRIVSPSSNKVRQFEMPRGRAIQVEDSTSERQPSTDLRRARTRDSDVVIQITVQDPVEDSSGSGKEEEYHKDSPVHEASEKGDSYGHSRDIRCSGNASGNEPSVESLEGNIRRSDRPSALKRCSQRAIAYNPMNLSSDNLEDEKIPDANGHHHRKLKVGPSGVTEVMETVSETQGRVGRNFCGADPCMMETELSFDDRGQLSLDSSCYGSDSEGSRDSVYVDTEKTQSPFRKSSLNSSAELPESVTSCDNNFKSSNIKSKSGDGNSKNKGSIREEQEHRSRRDNSVAKPKIHTADNNDASPMLVTEDLCDRDDLVKCSRWKERNQGFGFQDREYIPYHREKELSSRYSGETFMDNDNERVHRKPPYSRGNYRLRNEIDSYVRKKWDERDYCHEQRSPRVYSEDRDRDWYYYGEGHPTDYFNHLTYRESQLHSRYSSCSVEERDTFWRSKHGEPQLRKKTNHSHWLDYKHEDNFVPEKYKRSASFADSNRDSMDEKYERQIPYGRGELKSSVRRGRYGDSLTLDLDNPWYGETEDGYGRLMDRDSVDSQFYRETYSAGRYQHDNMSPRNNAYDSRLSERFGRRRRHICAEEVRDSGWLDNYNDADDVEDRIVYPDDQGHLGLRRYGWRSRVLHWTKDELILRHRDAKLYSEEASLSYEKITRHEKIRARYRSAHDGVLNDEMQIQRDKVKLIKKGSSTNCINRSSEIINRDEREQAVLRCRDSVNFVVGDGKSSRRRSKGRSFLGNGSSENIDQKTEKRTTLMDYNDPHMEKAVHPEIAKIESSQNNPKWLDKFPITEHNEDLDIEEGQIVTEEPNTEVSTGRRYATEDAALTCNNVSDGNKFVGDYDNQRFLETLAKMEKRRERFKEPITLNKEPGMCLKPQVDLIIDTDETKQQRPARKRRWGGS